MRPPQGIAPRRNALAAHAQALNPDARERRRLQLARLRVEQRWLREQAFIPVGECPDAALQRLITAGAMHLKRLISCGSPHEELPAIVIGVTRDTHHASLAPDFMVLMVVGI